MYTHTKPATKAEEIVLARARMLTDFRWTPLRDIPTYTIQGGHAIIPAGKEVTGFPYSYQSRIREASFCFEFQKLKNHALRYLVAYVMILKKRREVLLWI